MRIMLTGKTAIITGSAGALGTETTKLFLKNGAQIAALYHTEEKYQKLREILGEYNNNIIGVMGDATIAGDCEKLVQKTVDTYGKVDVLINIVGGWAGGYTTDKTPEETWDKMMDLNAKSVFLLCKAVLPHMMARNYGRIVSISAKNSMPGGRMKKNSAYAASKGAVRTLTEVMTQEYSDKNININCVIPSTIDTPANRKMMPKADYSKWVPPSLIAETIMFLCSDKGAEIRGASIPIYGKA